MLTPPPNLPLRGIIFDMDGTLGDTIPSIYIALRETFARYTGTVYSDTEITSMFGPSEEGVIGRRVSAELYEPAIQYFLQRYEDLHANRPFSGICELFSYIQERGVRIAVATGKGPRTAAISMRAYGLSQYIDRLETGSETGGIKPELIRRVLDSWNMPAHQAAYVGDAHSDMADAQAAGVLPLGAAWSQTATVTAEDTPYLFRTVEEFGGWFGEVILHE
jgi:phosphoglycolate phosphatase-like HAD superfamily hydrolase